MGKDAISEKTLSGCYDIGSQKLRRLKDAGLGVALLSATLCSSVSVGNTNVAKAQTILSSFAKVFLGGFSVFGGGLKVIAELLNSASGLSNIYMVYQMYMRKAVEKFSTKVDPLAGVDITTMKNIAGEFLSNRVVGQRAAKAQMFTALMNIAYKRYHPPKDPKDARPNVFYIVGPSGCGKNVMVDEVMVPVLCGHWRGEKNRIEPYVINAGSLDPNEDLKDQLFGYKTIANQIYRTGLSEYVINNPYGCIVINEGDKVKDKNGRTINEKIEELLREIMDNGEIRNKQDEVFDLRNMTFCFTSNEFAECVTNLDNSKPLDKSKLVDPSGSRTFSVHDKSVFNRSNMHVVTMTSHGEEDYIEMSSRALLKIMVELKQNYGVHLFYRDNFIELSKIIAKNAMKLNKGGRGVAIISEKLLGDLLNRVVIPNLRGDNQPIRKNFVILYDEAAGEFVFKALPSRSQDPTLGGLIGPELDFEGRYEDNENPEDYSPAAVDPAIAPVDQGKDEDGNSRVELPPADLGKEPEMSDNDNRVQKNDEKNERVKSEVSEQGGVAASGEIGAADTGKVNSDKKTGENEAENHEKQSEVDDKRKVPDSSINKHGREKKKDKYSNKDKKNKKDNTNKKKRNNINTGDNRKRPNGVDDSKGENKLLT